jgi:NCS1 family nucleobase:cation symporter-1
MDCIWYGVPGWIGGTCVYSMIRSIWNDWHNDTGDCGIMNSIPSSGTNTIAFVSFFLFCAGSLPALWLPVHKIRHLSTVKPFFVPTASVAFFLWAIVRAKGTGPIVHQPGKVHESALAWLTIEGTISAIATFATLVVNDPGFARFARNSSDAYLPQLITIPIGFTITSFTGIIVSSSSTVVFSGDPLWAPLDLLESFLNENGGLGQRFGVFIIAAAFSSPNSTPTSSRIRSPQADMAALAPG